MVRPSTTALSLLLLFSAAVAAAAAAPAKPDRLDAVKTDIRLKNFTAAAASLQTMAAAGDADAQYLLATFYLNGLVGPRDAGKARTWFEKSANQGNARAAFSLATLL